MCKVYNPVGSLTAVKAHLQANKVDDFRSVNELIDFRNNFPVTQQEIIASHEKAIQAEAGNLSDEIPHLKMLIDTTRTELDQLFSSERNKIEAKINLLSLENSEFFRRFTYCLKTIGYKLQLFLTKRRFQKKLALSLNPLTADYNRKDFRFNYITTRFDEAVSESAEQELSELSRKKNVIDQINSFIYGAIGEQRTVKQLENLPDTYHLINDFTLEFRPAIYHKQNNDYIKSIQIDHILLSNSGIFLIETKNWSHESIKNLNLRSPVQQIKRTNYAIYRLLNEKISNSNLKIEAHHWGERRIPIRNLIVLMKHKPVEEFQYVKVLNLEEMLSYINHFRPCLSDNEVQLLTTELLAINKN